MGANVALLRGLSLFRGLTEDQLKKVADLCSELSVFPGQTFFREGEPGKTIFVLPQGEVEILYTAGGEAMMGREWVSVGEVLGVRAMLPPYRYLTTVRSMTEGSLLAIDAIKLGELFQQDGQLAKSLIARLMSATLSRIATLRSLL
jgi:CRP-like cAMP-binding protein